MQEDSEARINFDVVQDIAKLVWVYGAYNRSGLVCQVSGIINVSAQGTCLILGSWI